MLKHSDKVGESLEEKSHKLLPKCYGVRWVKREKNEVKMKPKYIKVCLRTDITINCVAVTVIE